MSKWKSRLFDVVSGVFRSVVTKLPIKDTTVLSKIERKISNDVKAFEEITQSLIDGKIDLGQWQRKIAQASKDAWTTTSVIGRGGAQSMSQSDWGRLGGRLRYEYARLTEFAAEIKAGNLSAGQIQFRTRLYAQASRTGYYDGHTQAMIEAGYDEESRTTHADESCPSCLHYESLGWQPVGVLPEPGVDCECGRNCRCTKAHRTAEL